MKQIIYIDILLFLNTVITFFLLMTVKRFTSVKTSAPRLILASAVGGAYSLILLAPELNLFLMLFTKTAMSVSIVYIAFRSKRFLMMAKCFSLFLLFSCMYAGFIYAFQFLFHSDFITVNNGYAYIHLSMISLILLSAIVYGLIWFLQKTVFRLRSDSMIYDLVISLENRTVSVKALLDTGNSLKDAYTNQPVIILNETEAEKLTSCRISAQPEDLIEAERGGIPIRLLPIRALSGTTCLPAFTAESAEITGENMQKSVRQVCVAVTSDPIGRDKYQALINESIL